VSTGAAGAAAGSPHSPVLRSSCAIAQNTGRGTKPPDAEASGVTKPNPPAGVSTSVWNTTASTSPERGNEGSARSIAS
jgi:hypothetical protein